MLWMGIWVHPHTVTLVTLAGFKNLANLGVIQESLLKIQPAGSQFGLCNILLHVRGGTQRALRTKKNIETGVQVRISCLKEKVIWWELYHSLVLVGAAKVLKFSPSQISLCVTTLGGSRDLKISKTCNF